ncbi:MAG TPA: hypothetical protein VIV60_28750 [Polyangiaceae bacterium]
MKLGRSLTCSMLTLLAAAMVPGACGTDGLVGGNCAKGLTNCANHCVDLNSDRDNCGSCGKQCSAGVECIKGHCGGGDGGDGGWAGDDAQGGGGNHRIDGGSGTDGVDAGDQGGAFGEFDVTYPPDSGGTGQLGGNGGFGNGTGSNGTGSNGTGSTVPVCTPPYDSADHCGTCNTVCVEPTRVCAPVDGKFACVPFCDAPLVECAGACVDLNSDSDNCGQCGRVCPSAICQGGQCIGAQAGDIVAMCMNFLETTQASQATQLLGNAVFLPLFNPVKILAYDQYVSPTVRTRVDQTIEWASALRRAYRITYISSPEAVNQQLKKPDFDVFLVYDQPLAPAGTLGTYGTQWAKTLESFSHVGGTIVVLSGATGTKEMGQLLTNSRLLEVTAESSVSRKDVYLRQPGDTIGHSVFSPFRAPRDSCFFTTPTPTDSMTVFVVSDNATSATSQRPVVVHRIMIPPVK